MTDATAQAFPPAVSDRICKHMNDDHPDAVLLYVHAYAQEPAATAARMVAIDATGMDIAADFGQEERTVRVPFEPPLADAKAAHVVLVDMLKAVHKPAPSA